MRKLHGHLRTGSEAAVERALPKPRAPPLLAPHEVDLDEDLEEAGRVRALACGLWGLGFRAECPSWRHTQATWTRTWKRLAGCAPTAPGFREPPRLAPTMSI